MMYPFMTLNDDTEITHSEMKPDGKVKVYIETPDEKYCFKHATCWLPDYTWEDIFHYSDEEMDRFDEIIHSMAHLIMEFSQEGGFALSNAEEVAPYPDELAAISAYKAGDPDYQPSISQEDLMKELEIN